MNKKLLTLFLFLVTLFPVSAVVDIESFEIEAIIPDKKSDTPLIRTLIVRDLYSGGLVVQNESTIDVGRGESLVGSGVPLFIVDLSTNSGSEVTIKTTVSPFKTENRSKTIPVNVSCSTSYTFSDASWYEKSIPVEGQSYNVYRDSNFVDDPGAPEGTWFDHKVTITPTTSITDDGTHKFEHTLKTEYLSAVNWGKGSYEDRGIEYFYYSPTNTYSIVEPDSTMSYSISYTMQYSVSIDENEYKNAEAGVYYMDVIVEVESAQ